MMMAYLAVNAHQSFAEMRHLSAWELQAFCDHVERTLKKQNDKIDREMEEARLRGRDG